MEAERIQLNKKQKKTMYKLINECKESGFRSLSRSKIRKGFKGLSEQERRDIFKSMISEKMVIRLNDGRLIHPDIMNEVKDLVGEHIHRTGRITISECKDLLGVGRDVFIPILEYLDRINFTIRRGDHRVMHGEQRYL